jgi:predicted SAM-dependent methyltransferase
MNDQVETPLRIDVGGGLEPKPGYVNVDPYAAAADVRNHAWDLPYAACTVDEINCTHVLEHIEKRKVSVVLAEFFRVLKPGGLLVVEVPDLAWCCENWLQHRDDGWNLDALFGNQDPPGGQFHLTGFTQGILENRIREAGFRSPILFYMPWSHQQRCLRMELHK